MGTKRVVDDFNINDDDELLQKKPHQLILQTSNKYPSLLTSSKTASSKTASTPIVLMNAKTAYKQQKILAEELGIPEKCRHPMEEVSMHIDYIMNNVWEYRDKECVDAIWAKYPKKGNIMCVYKFENLINHKAYVGQSGNFWGRIHSHLGRKTLDRDKSDLYRAIRKHGLKNFEVRILKDSTEIPALSILSNREDFEALCVEQYDSFINGYNVQPTTTDRDERHSIKTDPRYRNRYRSLSWDQL